MKVPISDVRTSLVDIILSKGEFNKTDAVILADDYIEGEIQGKKSHGLAAFIAIVPTLNDKRVQPEIIKESSSALYVDAHGGFGSIEGRKIADSLIDKAGSEGVAVGYMRNLKSWLRPATVAQHVVEHNMVSFVINTGGPPMVAPPGGKDPVIGTNPIGIAIPAQKTPVMVDMATSKRAWGEVRLAKKFGHDLPADSYYDEQGRIAVNPEDAHAALPMGAYKGFALGLFIEIMGGSFVDMTMGKGEPNEPYYARTRGATIMVFNPDFTVGSSNFKLANQTFFDEIRASSKLPGSDSITIPGDRSAKTKQTNMENGYLDIEDKLWQEIKNL